MNNDVSAEAYTKFSVYLKARAGITLGSAKQYLVRSRLTPLLKQMHISDINEFIGLIVSDRNTALSSKAIEAMTTNETLWFRDQYPFKILSEHLLPIMAKNKRKLKIWSAACSSGQEPYSIAMTILEFQSKNIGAFSSGVEIIATDLSDEVLGAARKGLYDSVSISRGLPANIQSKYFTSQQDGCFQISNKVKSLVNFKQLNLIKQFSWPSKFDLVFCRNVLIYFDQDQKTKILQNISACLQSDGCLFLGASESLADAQKEFKMVRQPSGLYYQRP